MTLWHFQCPDCQYDDAEAGTLAADPDLFCPLCWSDSLHVKLTCGDGPRGRSTMPIPEPTRAEIEAGRRLLKRLLPWARAEARKALTRDGDKVVLESPLAKAMGSNLLTEDNLLALLIYPASLGGWHADVMFQDTPPGFPNSMGSPVGSPLKTRAEAERQGKYTLVAVLVIIEQNRQSKIAAPPDAVFMLYDATFKLFPEPLAEAVKSGDIPEGYGSPELAAARIEQVLSEIWPGQGYTYERLQNLDRDQKAKLWAVLHMAALSGLYVYPPRIPAPPMAERH